jgi:hypothetical protein
MERFIKTFKNEKINHPELGIVNLTFREYLLISNKDFNHNNSDLIFLRKIVSYILDNLNEHKLTTKAPEGSNHHELIYESTKDLMNKPLFLKAYSKHSSDIDDRRNDIELYKKEASQLFLDIMEILPDGTIFEDVKPLLFEKLHINWMNKMI